jgi:hypothetical protein
MTELLEELNQSIFGGADFVFTERTKENGEKEIIGGGYKLESILLKGGTPAMTSYNTSNQMGGKVSSPLESLAIPAGLFYINMRVPKNKDKEKKEDYENHYQDHKMISDDVFDKLFDLVEVDKKRQRKTRKNVSSTDKFKTHKTKIKTRKHK